jgi:hypothetical protein
VTGDYPTPTGQKLYQLALRQKGTSENGRTHEAPQAVVG